MESKSPKELHVEDKIKELVSTIATDNADDIHKYSANSIEKVRITPGNEKPLRIEIQMKAEVGFFQVEGVLIPKIQSSPAKNLLELYAGVNGEEMKRYF